MTSGTTEPAPSEGPLAGCAPSPVTTVGLPVGLSTHPPLAVPSMNWERRVGHPPTPLAGRNAADRLPGGEPCAGEPHARFGKGGLGRSRPRRDGSHAPEGKPPGLSPSAVPATPNQFPTSPPPSGRQVHSSSLLGRSTCRVHRTGMGRSKAVVRAFDRRRARTRSTWSRSGCPREGHRVRS